MSAFVVFSVRIRSFRSISSIPRLRILSYLTGVLSPHKPRQIITAQRNDFCRSCIARLVYMDGRSRPIQNNTLRRRWGGESSYYHRGLRSQAAVAFVFFFFT